MIDWIGVALDIIKAAKKEDLKVDPKYIVIKPRVLSDENVLRGVSAIRVGLAFYPPAALASPALGLGVVGFKVWKRISLSREYDLLAVPPIDPNMLRLSIGMDPELKKHYGELVEEAQWDDDVIAMLEIIYNDLQFITNPDLLIAKYPHMSPEYLTTQASTNLKVLGMQLNDIEQGLLSQSTPPEVEHMVREAFGYIRELFPAMNDWALFNSEGFDELLEIIDTIL